MGAMAAQLFVAQRRPYRGVSVLRVCFRAYGMDATDVHLYGDGDELLAAREPHGSISHLHARWDHVRFCGCVPLGFLAVRRSTPATRRAVRARICLRIQAPLTLICDIPRKGHRHR